MNSLEVCSNNFFYDSVWIKNMQNSKYGQILQKGTYNLDINAETIDDQITFHSRYRYYVMFY